MNQAVQSREAEMLALAVNLARRAGDIALRRIDSAQSYRKHDNSLVTTTDHEIQAMIASAVHEAYPDHSVCGEEAEPSPQRCVVPPGSRYCWVIDPLDGTRNYVARLPCFATSIAVLNEGWPVIGVIYEHNTRLLFSSIRGLGATCDRRPIQVNRRGPPDEHLLGVPSSKDELAAQTARNWQGMPNYVCRNLGSTAFEMGLVACGALSGMLGCRVKIWDIAAGLLIIEEAGGVVTDPAGRPLAPFCMDADPHLSLPTLAASRAMHATLLASLHV